MKCLCVFMNRFNPYIKSTPDKDGHCSKLEIRRQQKLSLLASDVVDTDPRVSFQLCMEMLVETIETNTADITAGLQPGKVEMLRGLSNFLIVDNQSITAMIGWRNKEWRKEVADIPPSKVGNNLCLTTPALALFQRQP